MAYEEDCKNLSIETNPEETQIYWTQQTMTSRQQL